MVKLSSQRSPLAEICKTPGVTLSDLARVSSISLPSIKQLEQYPPKKANTWLGWRDRVSRWIPLLGHAFPEALQSRAFTTCPQAIIEYWLSEYSQWADTEVEPAAFQRQQERESELLFRAAELDAKGDWIGAEKWTLRAVRLFPRHDWRWAYHQFTTAQLRINRGELDTAEHLITQTMTLHEIELARTEKKWEPHSRALGEATRAWSYFLMGEWSLSNKGFEQASQLARVGQDYDIVQRCLHMSARALAEPYVFRAYFTQRNDSRRLNDSTTAYCIKKLEAALDLNDRDSPRDAFDLWYMSVLQQLNSNFISGKRLLEKSISLFRNNNMDIDAISHSEISQIHLKILSSAWNVNIIKKCEFQLYDILITLRTQKYPYVYADALTTLAYCRLQQVDSLLLSSNRQEIADLLCLALIIHPYPKHPLWQFAHHFLHTKIAPALSAQQKISYIHTLRERIIIGEPPFDYILQWKFKFEPLDRLTGLF